MDNLVNATYQEKIMYFKGMEDYYKFEVEKVKAMNGGEI